jgi:hypothetical protein
MPKVPEDEVSGEYCIGKAGEQTFKNNQDLSFVPTPQWKEGRVQHNEVQILPQFSKHRSTNVIDVWHLWWKSGLLKSRVPWWPGSNTGTWQLSGQSGQSVGFRNQFDIVVSFLDYINM